MGAPLISTLVPASLSISLSLSLSMATFGADKFAA